MAEKFEVKTIPNEKVKMAVEELRKVVENSRVVESNYLGEYMTEWGKVIRETFRKQGLEVDLLYDFRANGYYIGIMLDLDYIGKIEVSWTENGKLYSLVP